MTDQAKPAPSYDDLKESVFPTQKNDLTPLANAAFAIKKWADIAAVASFALTFVLGPEALSLLVPTALASAGAGVASIGITARRRHETGADKKDDTQEVTGYRAAFRKAAGNLMSKQAASSALVSAAPFMLFFGFAYGWAAANGKGNAELAIATMLAAPIATLVGSYLGHKAKADNTKMNVYEAVIRREQQKPATPTTNP